MYREIIMRYNPIKILLAVLLLSSCGGTEKSEKTDNIIAERKPLELIDKGIKSFPLDHETDFQGIKDPSIFQENGKEYLTFYNQPNHSIYLFDYDSAKLYKKITLSEQGPNGVPQHISKYFIHRMDSIFIDLITVNMYLVNGNAEIIDKLTLRENKSVTFDGATTFKNNTLNVSVINNYLLNKTNKPFLRAYINWEVDSITSEFIQPESFINHYEEIQTLRNTKGKTIRPLEKHFVADDQYIYSTTPISDSIYIFEGNDIVKSIYAGIPSITIADYKSYMPLMERIVNSNSGSGSITNVIELNQPPYFTNLFLSPNHKYLYRLLSHGTKPKLNPYNNKEYPVITAASLLILNLSTEEITSIKLPVNELKIGVPISAGIFASNSGLHIQMKGQENENEIQFRVFGVK